jgi:hypothetical protein
MVLCWARLPGLALAILLGAMAATASMAEAPSATSVNKHPQPAQTSRVDPQIVGTWEKAVPLGEFTGLWIWRIEPDGAYSFRTDPPNIVPSHQGHVEFADGQWHLQAEKGDPGWSDEGSYRLEEPGTLVTKGRLGIGTWRRRDGDAPQDSTAE